jgi:hypothetical protein
MCTESGRFAPTRQLHRLLAHHLRGSAEKKNGKKNSGILLKKP